MINRLLRTLMPVLLLTSVGCQIWRTAEPQYVDPALPMSLNCTELVDYLNRQNDGLHSWRCTSTVMWVRLPNNLRQRLVGVIACQSPQKFRLTAENMIADVDLGSNEERCWMYARPGDAAVLTWRHEDTDLLQQMPTGMPYIDPNWLMLILGIKPLNADDYDIEVGPAGTRELRLTAIEDSPGGRPLRRVIKVDTLRGVIREHTVYDSESRPVVRAELSQHKSHNGHLIPGSVKLQFPQMDSEIELKFKGIETNPHLPAELWRVPDKNMQVVDLGKVVRHRMQTTQQARALPSNQRFQPPRVSLQPPDFASSMQTASGPKVGIFDGVASSGQTPIEEPDWDTPTSSAKSRQSAGGGGRTRSKWLRLPWFGR